MTQKSVALIWFAAEASIHACKLSIWADPVKNEIHVLLFKGLAVGEIEM